MFSSLPNNAVEFMDWSWDQIAPYYDDLLTRDLTPSAMPQWLADWSHLKALAQEALARMDRIRSANLADQTAQTRRQQFFRNVTQPAMVQDQKLEERWLACGLSAPGYEKTLAHLQAQKADFYEVNQPLVAQEADLLSVFDQMLSAQKADRKMNVSDSHGQSSCEARNERERVWRLEREREMADREALNDLWQRLFSLRQQMAQNAGFSNYLDYAWQVMRRLDYTPADCQRFHESIETVVVPVVTRLHQQQQARLELPTLRPWDQDCLWNHRSLRPFVEVLDLIAGCSRIFHRIDPQFGAYFEALRDADLLDLDSRPNKTGGGFARAYGVTRQAFILMNATGTADDVMTLIHEAGHTFYFSEIAHRSFLQMTTGGGAGSGEWTEFVALTTEMLALPYLASSEGGFYTAAEAVQAQSHYLIGILTFFPFMAMIDAFQHWAYTHPEAALDPNECDQQWGALETRFQPSIDWHGLESIRNTEWHRMSAIFATPLFFVEYGIARLGALQVWRKAMQNQAEAVATFRRGMALGGTELSLPDHYAAAGAKFAFDETTLAEAVALVESQLEQMVD